MTIRKGYNRTETERKARHARLHPNTKLPSRKHLRRKVQK